MGAPHPVDQCAIGGIKFSGKQALPMALLRAPGRVHMRLPFEKYGRFGIGRRALVKGAQHRTEMRQHNVAGLGQQFLVRPI